MLTNTRSTHLIRALDPHRATLWHHLFGTNQLPVKTAKPRWMWLEGQPYEVLAYDLDAGRLSDGQRARYAEYVSRKWKMPYEQARKQLDNWPLKAAGTEPVTAEPDASQERPLHFPLHVSIAPAFVA